MNVIRRAVILVVKADSHDFAGVFDNLAEFAEIDLVAESHGLPGLHDRADPAHLTEAGKKNKQKHGHPHGPHAYARKPGVKLAAQSKADAARAGAGKIGLLAGQGPAPGGGGRRRLFALEELLPLPLEQQQCQSQRGYQHVYYQHQAENDALAEQCRHDHLQQTEHDQKPVASGILFLKEHDDLQVNQQARKTHGLYFSLYSPAIDY